MLIVGAGFSGAVCARVLADAGVPSLVIDRRPHIGGNAYDEVDANGVLIHPYGPHIFHTNSLQVIRFLSRFTDWRFYEHRVLAKVDQLLLPIPINRTTINRLYNLNLSAEEVGDFLSEASVPCEAIKTSEDLVLSAVGRDLCDKFFSGYTKKQWGLSLSQLAAGVAARIPTRTNDDDRYFTDEYQFMPYPGYSELFHRMLDHPLIDLSLGEAFNKNSKGGFVHTVYSGRIDDFFDRHLGELPYRSLRFEHEFFKGVESFQPVGTVNFPNEFDYTRITEFKKLTGQRHSGTSIVREYPQSEGDPFYPVPRPENADLFRKYEALAQSRHDVTFLGRLAEYKYFNMDQVIARSLKVSQSLVSKLLAF